MLTVTTVFIFFLPSYFIKEVLCAWNAMAALLRAPNRTCQLFSLSFPQEKFSPFDTIVSDEPCLCLVPLFSMVPITFFFLFDFPSPAPPQKCCPISRLKRVDSEPADWLEATKTECQRNK